MAAANGATGRKQATRDIDGMTVVVSQMAAWTAYEVFGRLVAAVGESVLGAIVGATSLDIQDAGTAARLLAALGMLFQKLGPADQRRVTEQLLEQTTVNGEPTLAAFNLIFQGRVLALLRTIQFSLEVNYADFFDAARAQLAAAKVRAAASSAAAIASGAGPTSGP